MSSLSQSSPRGREANRVAIGGLRPVWTSPTKFGICTAAQSFTNNGPWSGDPGVAPIWHMGFILPNGSINHYDCGTNSPIGTIDWTFISTGLPFPYGDFVITVVKTAREPN